MHSKKLGFLLATLGQLFVTVRSQIRVIHHLQRLYLPNNLFGLLTRTDHRLHGFLLESQVDYVVDHWTVGVVASRNHTLSIRYDGARRVIASSCNFLLLSLVFF